MWLNLNPGAIGISGLSLMELADLAHQCGFGGLDLPLNELRTADDADRLREVAASRGLRWGLFRTPVDIAAPDDRFDAGLARLREVAPLLARAGCARTYDHIWPGHDERPYLENARLHIARLRAIGSVLADHGLVYGIEFIGPKTLRDRFRHPFIRRLDQALDFIAAAGPGVGLVLDLFHWYTSGGTPDDLRQLLPGVPIVNIHANDARPERARDAQLDMERALPMGTGVIDAPGALAALLHHGYDGPIIAEPMNPDRARLAALSAHDAASEAARALRALAAAGEARRVDA